MSYLVRWGEEKIAELESRCREQGLPLTLQRRVILEDLAGRCDHPTADQIYEAVTARFQGISRTTVYRVLETFVQLGVAQKISNPEAKARFDADTRRHHHVVCLGCNRVIDFAGEELGDLAIPAEMADGFTVVNYSLTVTGFCACCRGQISSGTLQASPGSRSLTKRRQV
jgi:Fur family peroxide stress response transcriptional regulator